MKQSSRKRYLGLVIRAAITFSIIGYLLSKLDWGVLLSQLVRADLRWLVVAGLLFGVTFLLASLRWGLLLRVQDIRLPLRVVTALTLIGQFFNTFMLGSVGGDLVKILYLQKYAPSQRTHATLSVIMDRALGLAVLVGGSLLALPWQMRSIDATEGGHNAIIALIAIFGAMVVGTAAIAIMPFHRAPESLRRLWHKVPHHHVIELVISGFRQHGVALRQTLASVVTAVAVTLVLNLAGYCIALAIGIKVTYLQLLVITTVAVCVTSLPISIGGHGVREGIFVIMFAASGVAGRESAILFSLLFFAVPLVWSLVGAIVYLTYRHDYGSVVSGEA